MDIELDGEITCRPITLEDLAKDNASLSAMYQFRNTVDDPVIQEHFDAVLRMASDELVGATFASDFLRKKFVATEGHI